MSIVPRSPWIVALLAASACSPRSHETAADAGSAAPPPSAAPPASASAEPPSSAAAPPASASAEPEGPPPLVCPKAMVAVEGRFCIDRWEASLVDKKSKAQISPYYPPDRRLAAQIADTWEKERFTMGGEKAQHMAIPALPAWEREREPDPVAVSRPGVKPNGYLTQLIAARACENAGKRLCAPSEWRTACRGEKKRSYPYGDEYVHGACNIFRAVHPAALLHDNASVGHLDPRLNMVTEKNGDPLLRGTGTTARCKSEWGDDVIWDMNGNIDEWVADEPDPAGEPGLGGGTEPAAPASGSASSPPPPASTGRPKTIPPAQQTGLFLGGFFSRSKKDGCASTVSKHLKSYFDYSTGTRCCWSPDAPKAGMLPAPSPAD